MREYEFLEKEPIETEHGVTALVRERRAAFAPEYDRANRIGAALCILAAVLGSVAAYAAILLGMKNPLVLEYLEKVKQKFRKIS